MKTPRVDVSKIRRQQIVEASVAIIVERGLQNLSLSEIEKRAGMSRGQLTYYFPAKEDILLAVFDHLLQLMHRRVQAGQESPPSCPFAGESGWDRLRHFLTVILLHPPEMPGFQSLHYTFLSQIGHRDDFRARLADLYEAWRDHMAKDLAEELARPRGKAVSSRTVATFVQALLHGLSMQRAADPNSYDRQEMLDLCLDVLGTYMRAPDSGPSARNGAPRRRLARKSPPREREQGEEGQPTRGTFGE
jgi:AcrR family transcriptional regulator